MHKLISNRNFDRTTNDQLRRPSFSIMLNIAEGSQNSLSHSHFETGGCNFFFEEYEFFGRVATRNPIEHQLFRVVFRL
jgi:hypothetical protein